MKLTRWFEPNELPVRVGEYNASVEKNPRVLRWWDGTDWSEPYLASSRANFVAAARKRMEVVTGIYWRGIRKGSS